MRLSVMVESVVPLPGRSPTGVPGRAVGTGTGADGAAGIVVVAPTAGGMVVVATVTTAGVEAGPAGAPPEPTADGAPVGLAAHAATTIVAATSQAARTVS